MSIRILVGDMRERLRELPAASVDSCVCDPPYHLTSIVKRFGAANAAPAKVGKTGAYARASKGFMGQTWDGGDVAFDPETWAEVLRVLKPGAHLVAFSGTRTYHRMVCAIEDAGFEVRDSILDMVASDDPVKRFLESLDGPQVEAFLRCIEDSQFGGLLSWIYGSGFPKSHDVSKGIDKMAGAEREVVGRNPNWRDPATNAEHHARWNNAVVTGDVTAPATPEAAQWQGWGTALKPAWEPICLARKALAGTVAANVLAHGTGALNIDGCRIAADDKTPFPIGANSADGSIKTGLHSKPRTGDNSPGGRWPANIIHDGSEEVLAQFPETESGTGAVKRATATGYQGNALGKESRPAGTAMVEYGDKGSAARFFYCAKATTEERGEGNNHPTVKPVDLMRWLCRLVTPKGGTVLDPFMGSGSTMIAADAEQLNGIGCELSPEYAAIAETRIRAAAGMFAEVLAA